MMIVVVGRTYIKHQHPMVPVSYNDEHLGTVKGRSLDELFEFNCQKAPVLRFIDLELNN